MNSNVTRYKPSLALVGNVSSDMQTASGWTAPEHGFMIGTFSTIVGSGTAYLYVNDTSIDASVYRVNTPENGMYTSASFPVIKGHTYKVISVNGSNFVDMNYYKYV